MPLLGTGRGHFFPRLLSSPAPRARSPQSRRGWNVLSSSRGRFLSAMLEADSCHRLRPTKERRGEGVEGHTARRVPLDPHGGRLGPPRWGGAAAPGPRSPLPPSPVGLCNPVAAARPRAGPWGEGRGRLGWRREAATRGAACPGPCAPAVAFPAPGWGGRRGEPSSRQSAGRRKPRAEAAALLGAEGLEGDTFWVEAVPEGRVGCPAGTRLPGHEFLCHRNHVSCQVRSRLRLSGFHLGPFLLAAHFYKKKELVLSPSNMHPAPLLPTPSTYLLCWWGERLGKCWIGWEKRRKAFFYPYFLSLRVNQGCLSMRLVHYPFAFERGSFPC